MILTPDQRLRVFVSSTLGELRDERVAVRAAIEKLRLSPVMFELGARPHPPRALYRAYLDQSHIFVAVYADQYGWVAPTMDISGLEDEYRLSGDRPKLVYVLDPAPHREPRLTAMLADVAADPHARVRTFGTAAELADLVAGDLADLLAASFTPRAVGPPAEALASDVAPGTGALPHAAESIVGRAQETEEVSALLRNEAVRLVTLTGVGGIGKSRLALEVAGLVEPDFPGGVVYVPLAHLPEPGLVVTSIANRMGIRLDASRPSMDIVAEALTERGAILLLLDNAEQVPDAAADLATLISVCPQLTVLVTSRSRLRLVAEHDHPLAPLDVGPLVAGFGSRTPDRDPAELTRAMLGSDAVRLFLERARASRPDLDLAADPVQLQAVAELCQRLDGLPLAIEIAAARVRLLLPTQLLARLEGRLDLPAARVVDLPERQRTLRATLDWSYDLLAPAERVTLAQLSTFVGGASLTALEEVVSVDGDLLESLAALADHSLVAVDAWAVDAPRFTMLETVRDYAREKLEAAGLAPAADAAHRAWVLAMSRRAQEALPGPSHAEWLERLEQEGGNIRVAGLRAHEDGDPRTLVTIVYQLWLWLWVRHHTREARSWVVRALERVDTLDTLTRARLHWSVAGAAVEQGDNELALSSLSAATELFTTVGDAEGTALCGFLDASLAPVSGEQDRAVAVFTAVETDLLRQGNVFVASICASTAGMILAQQGRLAEAEAYLDRSLGQAESIDNASLRGSAYVSRGFARLGSGALDQAGADLAAGAAWARFSRNPETLSFACDGMAALLLARGSTGRTGVVAGEQPADVAALLVGAALGLRDRVGIVPWPGLRPVMAAIADGVRAAAGEQVYQDAVLRGRRLSSDAILELATRAAGVAPTTAPATGAETAVPAGR